MSTLNSVDIKVQFEPNEKIVENHHKEIYSINFCDVLPNYSSYFASVGIGNSVSIYELYDQEKSQVRLIQVIVDEDKDDYYSCAWGSSKNGSPLILYGGARGIVKGINCISFEIETLLIGHGHVLNDIKMHPIDTSLCYTASRDESIRCWNIYSSVCLMIFAGEKGHRLDVLTIQIHPLGNCLLSGGMDTSIKMWNLEDPAMKMLVQRAHEDAEKRQPFYKKGNSFDEAPIGITAKDVILAQFPIFSTTQVHCDYVDSVHFVGDMVLSRCPKDKIVLWAPDPSRMKGAVIVLREFDLSEASIWFVRMTVCVPLYMFAVGSPSGKVFLYKLPIGSDLEQTPVLEKTSTRVHTAETPSRLPYVADEPLFVLPTVKSKCPRSTIRDLAISPDCRTMIACTDGGVIYSWNINIK